MPHSRVARDALQCRSLAHTRVAASMSRLFAAFAGPAPPPAPEPSIDVLKYHLRNMPLAGAVVYLTVILALHRLLRRREQPLGIPRSVLVVYNLVQVAINAYVAYAIAHAVGGWVFGLGLKDTPAVRHAVYLHYLCKVRTRIPPRPTSSVCHANRQPANQPVPLASRPHAALALRPASCTPAPWLNPISTHSPHQYLDMLDTVIIVLRKK